MVDPALSFIGFGEAAMAFALDLGAASRAYDRKTDEPATRDAKLADYRRLGVAGEASNAAATRGAALLLSLVTAGGALAAASETAAAIESGALFCDMNSVAPATKQAAARVIEARGGRYVDVAVMAPVHPARRAVPLLISGPYAGAARQALEAIGFGNVRVIDGPIGAASSVKMIRSVMIKGIEALTAECVLAAEAAGVRGEVLASLDASWPGADWTARADYNLDRMMVHGIRRAEELEEVVRTLDDLGTGSAMSQATARRQRALARPGQAPPDGLAAKLDQLLDRKKAAA